MINTSSHEAGLAGAVVDDTGAAKCVVDDGDDEVAERLEENATAWAAFRADALDRQRAQWQAGATEHASDTSRKVRCLAPKQVSDVALLYAP